MSHRPRNVGTDGRKLDFSLLKRLMNYVFSHYKGLYIFVFIGILISSLASVASSLFMKTLIDDYIQPLILATDKNFAPLFECNLYLSAILIAMLTVIS